MRVTQSTCVLLVPVAVALCGSAARVAAKPVTTLAETALEVYVPAQANVVQRGYAAEQLDLRERAGDAKGGALTR